MTNLWGNLKYYLEKEKLMSVAHLLVMSVTFLLLGIFVNIIVLTQTSLKYLEEQAQTTTRTPGYMILSPTSITDA